MKCPNCNKTVEIKHEDMEFYKLGRKAKCPECKKLIIFTRQSRDLVDNGKGTKIRKEKTNA